MRLGTASEANLSGDRGQERPSLYTCRVVSNDICNLVVLRGARSVFLCTWDAALKRRCAAAPAARLFPRRWCWCCTKSLSAKRCFASPFACATQLYRSHSGERQSREKGARTLIRYLCSSRLPPVLWAWSQVVPRQSAEATRPRPHTPTTGLMPLEGASGLCSAVPLCARERYSSAKDSRTLTRKRGAR